MYLITLFLIITNSNIAVLKSCHLCGKSLHKEYIYVLISKSFNNRDINWTNSQYYSKNCDIANMWTGQNGSSLFKTDNDSIVIFCQK
jgi:hypothetical protein